jgi:hypothetical protein
MAGNGGKREGAGRKPKAQELELIESLGAYDELAKEKLIEGVTSGSFHHLKLFFEYRYGKPKQILDVTTNGESINQFDLKTTVETFLHGGNDKAKTSISKTD